MTTKARSSSLITAIIVLLGCSASNQLFAASGDLDPTFGSSGRVQTSFPGFGTRVSIQPNGKIITHSSGSIFRLNRDGTLDPTFATNGQLQLDPGADFASLPDGRILVTTTLYSSAHQQWFGAVYWFDADGNPPLVGIESTEFALCYCDTRGYKIATGPNGQFFVAAIVSTTPQTTVIAKFNADGTQSSFTVSLGTRYATKMLAQPDGKLVVLADGIRRYNADGTPDQGFGAGGRVSVWDDSNNFVSVGDLALQANGKILVGYQEDNYFDSIFYGVKRFNSDGSPDTTFTAGATSLYSAIALQPDGKILVGGQGSGSSSSSEFALCRLLPNGDLDYSFGQSGIVLTGFGDLPSAVYSLAIQSDGKIIAAGAGGNRVALARYENEISRTAFDFDGDGRADISVFRPSNGLWYLSRSQAGFGAMGWGEAADKITPADYDGDGRTDMAVWRPSTGVWYVVNSGTGSFRAQAWGEQGDIPVPADFDGDEKADLTVFRPSTGLWYRINSSNGHWVVVPYAQQGDVPVVSDYDGDGRADLAVYRPSNGIWYIQQTSAGYVAILFGSGSGPIAPADYTGDGRTDIGVISPTSGNWVYYNWDTGLPTLVLDGFYQPGDIPVPADYDGDGRANFAIFRPANGIWRIPGPGGTVEVQFGEPGDTPTPVTILR